MKMYEPFNRTLNQRVKDFYNYNKEYILSGVLTLATITTLMSGVSYCAYRNDLEVKKNLKTLEQVIDEPRSEERDLRYHFERAKLNSEKFRKQPKNLQNK